MTGPYRQVLASTARVPPVRPTIAPAGLMAVENGRQIGIIGPFRDEHAARAWVDRQPPGLTYQLWPLTIPDGQD